MGKILKSLLVSVFIFSIVNVTSASSATYENTKFNPNQGALKYRKY
ncbi:hypothetical protein J27TS8_06420 [Robertmurraya siralis]|uniref:Uncharacterized protein n=1 Tax=Robertmurraya siralis TaxID=77777 RepID=A0A920BSE8_9BACI|nr:hypothetical protein [Robertmurraya siralis]GIN60649.1 hypothetical protein J27TS8_06420 [Robertmurraya siralis]